jgi:sialate O-acetylesterase
MAEPRMTLPRHPTPRDNPMTKYLVTALVLCAAPCLADVRLPKILGSNMVLQRDSEVTIWGWSDAGEEVRVTCDWLDTAARVDADADGKWQVSIKTGEAGGPHSMTIAGKNSITLEQILFGQVWIGSGQSNMEMPLVAVSGAYTSIKDSATEVAEAKYPEIRIFQAGNFSSKEPLDDVESGISMYGIPPAACKWQACTPATIPTFASTAYFFARELHTKLNVPIGIIDASWGGTSAETWVPASGLKALGFTAELEQAATLPQKPDQKIPTRLYNGMIHPLRKFTIKGVVWYQGEGNAGRADKYRQLFSTMIREWREAFGYEFSFYFVQISPFNYGDVNAAYLREAQLETLSLPKTGLAVTMDIGNLSDIHPKNKQEVGRRLALWALANDYGRDVVCSGPVYREWVPSDGQARLKFDHVGGGLATRDGEPPSHFEIAGADQVFHQATAVIEGNEVVVSSAQVAEPKAVRYAFTSNAMPNLMNKKGLPASSFRTDSW